MTRGGPRHRYTGHYDHANHPDLPAVDEKPTIISAGAGCHYASGTTRGTPLAATDRDTDERRRLREMGYKLRNHTADVAVEAHGPDLDTVFAGIAAGLTAAQCEDIPTDQGARFSIVVQAESREAVLFDYLDELIYQRDIRSVLPADHDVHVVGNETWIVEASARGIPLESIAAREVKAVTYSDMELEETPDGWRAYVVFDV